MNGAENLLNDCNAVASSTEIDRKVNLLKNCIQQLADSLYGVNQGKVYLYGSRYTGLAQNYADVDIYVDLSKNAIFLPFENDIAL